MFNIISSRLRLMNYNEMEKWMKQLDLSIYKLSLYGIYALGLISMISNSYELFNTTKISWNNYNFIEKTNYNKSIISKAAEDLIGVHHYRHEHMLELIHP
jgi:hypothetical protein